MLAEGLSSEDAVKDLAENPAFRREVIEANAALQARAAACGRMAVLEAIGKLFAVYPQPNRSEPEWAAFWETYTEALEDLPLEALRDGLREAVRDAKAEFLPKPGPIRALCLVRAGEIWSAAYRARRVAALPAPARKQLSGAEFRELNAIIKGVSRDA